MNLITIKRTLDEGNGYIADHRYVNTYELEVGWNRIKINVTEHDYFGQGYGFVTWYPFSFYWWPPNNQWFRRRLLGIHIHRRPTPGVIG